MVQHSHQLTIADREAVRLLRDKVAAWRAHQQRREKLLKALDRAVILLKSTPLAGVSCPTKGSAGRPTDRLLFRPAWPGGLCRSYGGA
jgi:hypothetical protein